MKTEYLDMETDCAEGSDGKTQGEHLLQAKECLRLPEARKDTEPILPQPLEGTNPANTLILDFWFPNFVSAAPENYYRIVLLP